MKRFENILICSDIDGTLLSGYTIPQRNLDRLKDFCSEGGLFTLSTGRNHTEIDFVAEPLAKFLQIPISICNGSTLYDLKSGAFVNAHYLDPSHLTEVVSYILKTFPDKIRFHSGTDETGFVRPQNASLSLLREKKFFKLLLFADADAIRVIHADVSEKFGSYYTFTIAAAQNFEILPLGGSKMFQFAYLKEHYPAKTIWAIGDYDNDLEMLRGADYSACPENATDTVKAVATYQVSHCGDGALADLIDLIEQKINQHHI